jgi:DNA-binding transcriptional LysR family regulator
MHNRMNWDAVRFDWTRARAFLATAEEGSLSAAARVLKLAQPTLGRQVEALEQELGVVLFERVGRRLVLTPAGLDLLEHVRTMGEAAQRVALLASGQSHSLDGPIRISAGSAVAAYILPPVIAELRAAHPDIEITIIATGTQSDLQMREADIAIRNAQPTQNDLIAKRTPDRPAGLFARRDYLEGIGGDLSRADFIGFEGSANMARALTERGYPVEARQFRILSEAHLVQWAYVRRGMGVGLMMDEIALADPDIVRAVPGFSVPVPMWLLAHREVRTSRRVRVVYDMLAEALSQLPERPVPRV